MPKTAVKIIEYTPRVDFFNCLTHVIGMVVSLGALVLMTIKSQGGRDFFCSIVYGFTMLAVYTVSSVYHGIKPSSLKARARLADHCTVPLLIAGTATPCALITLWTVSKLHGILVFSLAWLCTIFGIISKLFFFEKLKSITMAAYIISSAVMLFSVIPLLGQINSGAFGKLVIGCVFYLIGAILCGLGQKWEYMHPIFHVFVLLGSTTHFYVIYTFVLGK